MVFKWKKPIAFKLDETFNVKIGDSNLHILRKENRWRIELENPVLDNLLKKETKLNTYACKNDSIVFLPALPEDVVVLKSQEGIFLMPHEKIELFIPVPAWIQIFGSNAKPSDLMYEFPSRHLSDTWFGEPQSGEKAYSIHFDDSFFESRQLQQMQILCPVEVHNDSENKLEFHRFALRTMHLSVYENAEGLISNKTRIKYKGEEQTSEISYDKKGPGKASTLLNMPRMEVPGKFLGRSFSFANKSGSISIIN